jgi:threonine dehydratase
MESPGRSPPALPDIEKAADRIAGVASKTPLVDSPALSRRFNRKVYLKLECYQPIRVFKIRGAFNKVSQIKERGVVAVSSGNHGMAVAFAARATGKRCTVILPQNPVKEKEDAIRDYGAEVIKMAGDHTGRFARAEQMVKETGVAFVHPYDDAEVMAGQGTCGLEITEQLPDFDSVLVPVGGGGLIGGISTAVKARKPRAKVFGVETELAPKLRDALRAGKPVKMGEVHSVADGLVPPSVGELPFRAITKNVDGSYTATEEQILQAVELMVREARVIPEPSGAAGVAALLAGKDVDRLGERVVVVVSGGNISSDLLGKILAGRTG